jgi:hypothetical protein
MVMKLRLTAPLREDQTLASYVGTLAAINFQPDTDDFCRDMGTNLVHVANGHGEAIARIAQVSGVDADLVERAAFRRTHNRALVHRGQTLTLHARTPMTVKFCPSCLLTVPPDWHHDPQHAVYGRTHWMAWQYRTCTQHCIQLASISTRSHGRQHDFMGAILPLLDVLPDMAATLVQRDSTGLDAYVERRLNGRSQEYLDGFGFSVAVRLCDMLGAVALFGRWPPHLGFDDQQWHLAGGTGYDIASKGADAIRDFLSGLKKTANRDSREGPHADWGILYNWMQDTRDPEIEPLLELARDHIESSYPIAAGQRVLGRKTKERRMHSVWSASLEHKIHVDVVRSQLSAAGVIIDDSGRYDNQILFPAPENRPLLESLARGVSALHAREYINCERQVFPVLVAAGILSPIVPVDVGYPLFDTEALDRFIAALMANCVTYDTKPADLETIATARMKVGCSQAEIVELILQGRLKRLGKLGGVAGYASVLVDPAEVAPLVRGEELGGIVVTHITTDLGIPHAGLVKMLDKQLPTSWRMHPKRRCLQQVVDQAVYDEFKSEYVSLRDLSRAAGVNHRQFQAKLRHRGIQPEPGFPAGVHLYRRSTLP